MKKPLTPTNEAERLHALRALDILDTPAEERFDRVTRLAKRMFNVSIALVSLVDENRQWFKSKQGLDAEETPRDISFCGHAINQDRVLVVNNALDDERFFDNPLVMDDPKIRFYAGYPLMLTPEIKIGTLCLIDSEPHELSTEDAALLEDLGAMIEDEIRSTHIATLDELTRISNRRGVTILAEKLINMCGRIKKSVTVVLFDLNKFKAINDTYGHKEGDDVLAAFAQALLASSRDSDAVGRWGGDEFVAIISDADVAGVEKLLARLRVNLAQRVSDKPYDVSFCAGHATCTWDQIESFEAMVEQADAAMYCNK